MAIAYVGGTSGANSGSFTLTLTYTSTVGNTLFLSLQAGNGFISVIDSNGTTWTPLGDGAFFTSAAAAYIVHSPAISSVTITCGGSTPSVISAALAEYSGIGSLSHFWLNGSGQPATPPSPAAITETLDHSTDFLITCGSVVEWSTTFAITANTGNLRQKGTVEDDTGVDPGWYAAWIGDNTGAGAVTFSVNLSGTSGSLELG